MKVLLIDQLSPKGHIKYVNFWIEIFRELNINFDIIGKDDFLDKLVINEENIKEKIPNKFYKNVNNKNIFIREIFLLRLLIYIYRKSEIKNYDYVFFLSFENLSMFFAVWFHKKNIGLVLHNNLKRINEKITYSILKKLSKSNFLISLDEFIKKELEIKNIESKKINHPLLKIELNIKEKNKLKKEIVIFSPSKSSIDEELIESIIRDKELLQILNNNEIKLILRSSKLNYKSDRLIVRNDYLSEEEYNELFFLADIIFLPYTKNFNLRISAVLLESLNLNKALIIPKYNTLRTFLEYKNSSIEGFKDLEELKVILLNIDKLQIKANYENLVKNYSKDIIKKQILSILIEK